MLKTISRTNYLSLSIWVLAILIRVYGLTTPAQSYDIGTFHAWGAHLLSVGPSHFFGSIWSDYLPLPILAFGPIAWLSRITSWNFSFVFKLIMSLLELTLIFWLSRVWVHRSRRWVIFFLLLSPALIGDTAFWGQIDSIPALLGLLSLVTLSPVLFGLAVAIKPIMIILAPVIWMISLKKQSWWHFPLISGGVFLTTGIPTGGIHFFSHLWGRVMGQVGTYPYASINAWNLWSLVPQNIWVPDATSVFGLTSHSLGLILFFLLVFLTLRTWSRVSWHPSYAYRVIATILILFYAFTTRMHERHLLFGLPFLTLAVAYQPWLLFPLTLLTGVFTLNLWAAFSWVTHSQVWPVSATVITLSSWLTVLTALMLSTIWDAPRFFKSLLTKLKLNKLIVAVFVLASLLRLVNLGYPQTYIFDEVYHAFTSKEYLHNHVAAWEWWTTPPPGVAYEWTHPPVAKYGMVLGMLLFGENSFGWRIGSAVAGVLSIYGLYLLTLALTKNKLSATLAAFLLSIEGLHISQSRIAMNDIYMLAFLAWALYLSAKLRWKSAAILFGFALASKWSALYGLLPLALLFLRDHFTIRKVLTAIRLLLIVIAVYLLTFTPFILAGHTWQQFIELHRQMWYYHTHLVATHAYQSTPSQWIFSLRPVWYFVNYGTLTSNIYAQGNPLILWFGLTVLILGLKKLFRFPTSFFYLAYAIFTLPWIFSPRIMFFYHYLPSSSFLCLILADFLAKIPTRSRNIILAICVFGFLLVAPMLYGIPLGSSYWHTLFAVFPSWK